MSDIQGIHYTLNGAQHSIEKGVANLNAADEAYVEADTALDTLLSALEGVTAGVLAESVKTAIDKVVDAGFVNGWGIMDVALREAANPHAQAAVSLAREAATRSNTVSHEAIGLRWDVQNALKGLGAVIEELRNTQARLGRNRQAIDELTGVQSGNGIAQAAIGEIVQYREEL